MPPNIDPTVPHLIIVGSTTNVPCPTVWSPTKGIFSDKTQTHSDLPGPFGRESIPDWSRKRRRTLRTFRDDDRHLKSAPEQTQALPTPLRTDQILKGVHLHHQLWGNNHPMPPPTPPKTNMPTMMPPSLPSEPKLEATSRGVQPQMSMC